MKPTIRNFSISTLIACGLLVGAVRGNALVTVKVDSSKPWLGWMSVWETNGSTYLYGNPWNLADLPAAFEPANSPSGWPLNTLLVLKPNTSTYDPFNPFWNFPDGRPSKVLAANVYVDVFTNYAGQTVVFKGLVTSNSVPRLTRGPASGWEAVAFIEEFTTTYEWVGSTTVPLKSNSPFSISRAIGRGKVCQYGFYLKGPNTATGSTNALTGVGIVVEDPDPLITASPWAATISRGATTQLSVSAVGGSSLSYQWKRDGVVLTNGGNISGADTATLTISNAQVSDSGDYVVTVSDLAGAVDSPAAQLTVLCALASEDEPFFIQTSARHTNDSFTLVWDSCNNHLYEVQTCDELSASSGWVPCALIIGGADTTSWTQSASSASGHRFYRVQRLSFTGDQDGDGLSNLEEFNNGTDLHNPDTDGDELPDGWEVKYGLNPLNPVDAIADSDGDGYNNLQELQLHTRPNASYSHPADPPRSLVGWWKLDEGSGTNVFDSSLNGHHGYVRGGNPNGVWTVGYFSGAVTLGSPANNWIEVPYQPTLAPTQEFTLMGWVKPAGQGFLAGNWDSAGQGNYRLEFGPEAIDLRFSPAGGGSYSTLHLNPNWSAGQWHHVAVCYSKGTNVTVFVDGERRADQTVEGPYLPAPNPFLIGSPGSTDTSSVDDVRLYSRALDTNEIASLSLGNGLPVSMIVGQTAQLRAFGASESDTCQWSVVSGPGFFTNTANLTTEFKPSWAGAVTIQVICSGSGGVRTNIASADVTFPSLSPIADWNLPNVQPHNNCYNFATDIRTDTLAQPGGPPFYFKYTCDQQILAALSDGLQGGVNLDDLCHTSGLPEGHIVALLIWPGWDFHYVRLEANGTWSSKAGNYPATTLDNSGQPILDPRTANFAPYQFCQFFWVGPDASILHFPQ